MTQPGAGYSAQVSGLLLVGSMQWPVAKTNAEQITLVSGIEVTADRTPAWLVIDIDGSMWASLVLLKANNHSPQSATPNIVSYTRAT